MHTNGIEKKKKDTTAGLDDGKEVAKLMAPFYRQLIADAFGDASDAGIDVAFDLDNPFVQTVLKDLAKKVRGVAETTREDIRMLIGQQAGNGWSNEELAQAIRDQGITRSESRAMLIARTETAAAYSQGSIAAYRASGVVKQTEWLTAGDDLDCPICADLNGMRADLGGSFGGGIDAPPAHPNCRCALSPILE